MVDWMGAILAILKAAKKSDSKVDSKYLVIKPRVLSDENLLRGLSGLQALLAFIPPAAIAAPAIGLGAVGFKIWKRISLGREYDRLEYPPMDPNMLRLSIQLDAELNKHYGTLVSQENWLPENVSKLEPVFNDFQFITNFEILKSKYPHVSSGYITKVTARNRKNMETNISTLEQTLVKHSTSPEVEHKIRAALEMVKEIFPAMNDWSLLNSEGFDEITEILDTIF